MTAWDLPLLRGSVVTMDAMAGRLRSWRVRLDGVGRDLAAGTAWSGPSARRATAVLDEVSAATSAVDVAMAEATAAFRRLVAEADTAQAYALRAVVASGGTLAEAVLPAEESLAAVRDAALAHAEAAAEAAEDARAAMAGLDAARAVVPADLADRTPAALHPAGEVPLGRPPVEVAGWWAGLPAATQIALLDRRPAALGGLDGMPAWARDRANRRLLARAADDPELPRDAALTAGSVAERIAAEEAAGRQVQLHLLDLEAGRVVLALGDVDAADAVAVLVPGIGNSPADDLDGLTGDARDVGSAARSAAPGLAVATMVWLGYRTPHSPPAIVSRASAWQGGPALAAALAGLAESRAAAGHPPPRTTVLAHSYGTVVADEAADVPGDLAADAVVLLGSPGMEGRAADLEAPEVYDATSDADLVSFTGWFGVSTRAEGWGSTALPWDPGTGHSGYYDRGSATLSAVGEVVSGREDPP